jgi:hypothetical protein
MVRRVERHPVVRHLVRDVTFGVIPDAVNDIAFHNAHLNIDEVVHAVQDTSTLSIINLIVKTMLVPLTKIG